MNTNMIQVQLHNTVASHGFLRPRSIKNSVCKLCMLILYADCVCKLQDQMIPAPDRLPGSSIERNNSETDFYAGFDPISDPRIDQEEKLCMQNGVCRERDRDQNDSFPIGGNPSK